MTESRLPDGWVQATFDDVASVASDLVDPKATPDAPHIAPNHIESGTGRLLPFKTVKEDKVTSPKHRFRPGQILYSKIRPYLAKAVLVDFDGLCSADMYPIDAGIDAGFLHRWMVSSEFTALASGEQGRTVLPKINQKALALLRVPTPPLNEQRRIVAKIDALFARSNAAKERLDQVPALLDRLRQSILAAAFRGDLTRDWRAQNPDVEPTSELLKRIRIERRAKWEEAELAKMRAKGKEPTNDKWKAKYKEPEPAIASELPELPEGWAWAAAEELTQPGRPILYGIIKAGPHDPDGIPMVRVTDITSGQLSADSLKRCSPARAAKFERATLAAGDLLISKDGTIGRIAFVPDWLAGGNITQHVLRFSPAGIVRGKFLGAMIEAPSSQRWMKGETRGVALQGVNVSDFRRLPIPLAPLEEQDAVVSWVANALGPVDQVSDLYRFKMERFESLSSSILSRAFSGKLVPQNPDDEPASVLLERIRAEREVAEAAKKAAEKAKKKRKTTKKRTSKKKTKRKAAK